MRRYIWLINFVSCICVFTFLSVAWSAVLFDDTTTKSGITPLIGKGSNTIKFKNDLRRRTSALLFLIEATDSNGKVIPYDHKFVKKLEIPSTQKLEGLFNTIVQWIQGNTALTPAYSKEAALTFPDDCSNCLKAKYKMVVVGPGTAYGDGVDSLNDSAKNEVTKEVTALQMDTFLFDIAIPVVLLVLPDSVKAELGEKMATIHQDKILMLSFLPLLEPIMTKFTNGQVTEAVQDFFNSFLTNDDLKTRLAEYLTEKFANELSAQTIAKIKTALKSVDISNKIMTILDQIAIISDITSSSTHMADVWYAQVTAKTLRLKPRATTVANGKSVTITAEVKDGGQPYEGKNLKFLWATENDLGILTAPDGSSGHTLYSADKSVTYTPQSTATSTSDTIKVTADELGEEFDSASAKVYITNDQVYYYGGCKAFVNFSKQCRYHDDGWSWCTTLDCLTCITPASATCLSGTCVNETNVSVVYPVGSCDNQSCVCFSYYVNPETDYCGWIEKDQCMGNYIELFWALNPEKSIPDLLRENCYNMHLMKMVNSENGWSCPCEELCPFYSTPGGDE
jgi:hypothetical protein